MVPLAGIEQPSGLSYSHAVFCFPGVYTAALLSLMVFLSLDYPSRVEWLEHYCNS